MQIEIHPASLEEKPILTRLMELYLYDFSIFIDEEIGDDGIYGYNYLDAYWVEPHRFPFLFRVEGKLAGFALVRRVGEQDGLPLHSMTEFFVMKKYRRLGVGKAAAFWLFNRFAGAWQVEEVNTNLTAQVFWRRVIQEYSRGQFQEVYKDDDTWHGPVQSFVTPQS